MEVITTATRSRLNRRTLATKALEGAVATRARANLDQHSPICVYKLCQTLGVVVRFNDINMEGMYQRGIPPRIHLSALRPLPRRTYNCAHELGHHIFGHASSIDQLREEAREHPHMEPKEFLADAFAGFLLMPIIGLRRAFAVRRWTPETATCLQIFTIACDFGVGYNTLLTHLSVGVKMISRARCTALQRVSPKTLRTEILGVSSEYPLVLADRQWLGPTLDTEVKTLVVLPHETNVTGDALVPAGTVGCGRLFQAVHPGVVQARTASGDWAIFVRISRQAYVGLAQYRHLDDDPDE